VTTRLNVVGIRRTWMRSFKSTRPSLMFTWGASLWSHCEVQASGLCRCIITCLSSRYVGVQSYLGHHQRRLPLWGELIEPRSEYYSSWVIDNKVCKRYDLPCCVDVCGAVPSLRLVEKATIYFGTARVLVILRMAGWVGSSATLRTSPLVGEDLYSLGRNVISIM
jgi:hypothetical protein